MSKGFSKAQLDKLRTSYSSIKGIDPTSATGKKFTDFIHNRSDDELRSLQDAGINFVSTLSRVELGRRKSKVKEDLELEEYLDEAKQLSFHQAKRYAVNNIKDSDSAIEIWRHKSGSHDINKSKNTVGAKWLKDMGAKKVHVVTKESVEEPVNEVSAALKMRYVRAAEKDVAIRSIRAASHLKKTGSSQNVLDVRNAQKNYNKEIDKSNKRTIKVDNVARKLTNEGADKFEIIGEIIALDPKSKGKEEKLSNYTTSQLMNTLKTLQTRQKHGMKNESKDDMDDIDDLPVDGTFKELKSSLAKMVPEERKKILQHIDKKLWPILGVNEDMKEDNDLIDEVKTYDSGWRPAKKRITDKSGADHSNPISRVHHLARLGRDKADDELPPFKGGHKVSKEDPMKHVKRLAKMGLRTVTKEAAAPSGAIAMPTGSKYDHTTHAGKSKAKALMLAIADKKMGVKGKVKESVENITEVRHPLAGHDYHTKSDMQLAYIRKDAGEAKRAMSGGHNPKAENKYADQVNDAVTVSHFRRQFKGGKMPGWYARKYGHKIAEETQLDELSRETMGRYMGKAIEYRKQLRNKAVRNNVVSALSRHKKYQKRGAGVARAAMKIESTELQEATFSANISDADYQKIRSASMRGNFTHKFTRKTNGDTRFSTSSPKKLASDLQKIIDAGENSWNEILGIDAAEIKSKGKTKRTFAHMESNSMKHSYQAWQLADNVDRAQKRVAAALKNNAKSGLERAKAKLDQANKEYDAFHKKSTTEARLLPSADKKPEEYIDANGEKKVRMVPVNRKVDEGAVPVVKGDTVRMTHKTSGKTIVINSKAQKKYESMGYVLKEETVNELSKATKHSYIQKAYNQRYKDTAKWMKNPDDKETEKRLEKRVKGINSFWTKHNKGSRDAVKEESLDEISKGLAVRYAKKANTSLDNEKDTLSHKAMNRETGLRRAASSINKKGGLSTFDKIRHRTRGFIGVKEESLDEISQSKKDKYLDRAVTDHGMQNVARRNEQDPNKKSEYQRKETNRRKGINRAVGEAKVPKYKVDTYGKPIWDPKTSSAILRHTEKEIIKKTERDRIARKKLWTPVREPVKKSQKESVSEANVDNKLAAQLAARKAQRERMKGRKVASAAKKSAVASGQKPVAKPTMDKGKNAMDDRHIIMQLRSAQDLDGNKEIQFRRGTGKLDIATINTILKVHDKFTKPNDKRRLFIAVSKSADDAKKTADKFKNIKF